MTLRPVALVGVVFFVQAEDGIRDYKVTGVQTCALPISIGDPGAAGPEPSRMRPTNPSSLSSDENIADRPDERCSTRPWNRRRPGRPPAPKCTDRKSVV